MRRVYRPILLQFVAAVLLGVAAMPAAAQREPLTAGENAKVAGAVDLGWEGYWRADRWMPARLRAQTTDGSARPVVIQWYVPRPGREAMVIQQRATLNGSPGTFLATLPIGPDPAAIHVHVRDAETMQTLAWWPESPRDPVNTLRRQMLDVEAFVGTTGLAPVLQTRDDLSAGYIEPANLPRDWVSYDGLDALVINSAELDQIDFDAQRAILDWVDYGGRVYFWLGPTRPPNDAPLAQLFDLDALERKTVDVGGKSVLAWTNANGEVTPIDVAYGSGRVTLLRLDPRDSGSWPAFEYRQTPPVRYAVWEEARPSTVGRPIGMLVIAAIVLGPIELLLLWLRGSTRGWIRKLVPIGVAIALLITAGSLGRLVVPDEAEALLGDEYVGAGRGDIAKGRRWWRSIGYDRTHGPIRDIEIDASPDGFATSGMPPVRYRMEKDLTTP